MRFHFQIGPIHIEALREFLPNCADVPKRKELTRDLVKQAMSSALQSFLICVSVPAFDLQDNKTARLVWTIWGKSSEVLLGAANAAFTHLAN